MMHTSRKTPFAKQTALFAALVATVFGAFASSAAAETAPLRSAAVRSNIFERALGPDGTSGGQIRAGESVANAGDVNGDGKDDYLVGAPGAVVNGAAAGAAYVVYGAVGRGSTALDTDLATLSFSKGYKIEGASVANQRFGFSVANAGDVNGDNVPDQLIGAPGADPISGTSGAAYVVYGRRTGTALSPPAASSAIRASVSAPSDRIALTPAAGYVINGDSDSYYPQLTGYSVASAGDVNFDGVPDQLIGAPKHVLPLTGQGVTSPSAITARFLDAGMVWVVLGRRAGGSFRTPPSGAQNAIELDVAMSGGCAVSGGDICFNAGATASDFDGFSAQGHRSGVPSTGTEVGSSVASASDVNGDTRPDILVSAPGFSELAQDGDSNKSGNGAYFVIYSPKSLPTQGLIALSGDAVPYVGTRFGPTYGYRIDGQQSGDAGCKRGDVSSAGDVNGDGVPDQLLGAPGASPDGKAGAGTVWVLYGRRLGVLAPPTTTGPGLNDLDLDGTGGSEQLGSGKGYRIDGEAAASPLVPGLIGSDCGLGTGLDLAGDISGDGRRDHLLGGGSAGLEADYAGRAYTVYSRPTGGTLAAPTTGDLAIDLDGGSGDGDTAFSASAGRRYGGPESSSLFGFSIAALGDVTGDGEDDILFGAPGLRSADRSTRSGSAYVLGTTRPVISYCPDGVTPLPAVGVTGCHRDTGDHPEDPPRNDPPIGGQSGPGAPAKPAAGPCTRLSTARVTQNVSKWSKFGRAARVRVRGPKAGFFVATNKAPTVFSVFKYGVRVKDAAFKLDGKSFGTSRGARPRLRLQAGTLKPGMHKLTAKIRATKHGVRLRRKSVTSTLRFRVLACPPAKMTVRMSRRKVKSGFDLRLNVDSGGPALSTVTVSLPSAIKIAAAKSKKVRGKSFGKLSLGGKQPRSIALKFPKKPRGTRLSLSSGATTVKLKLGKKPQLEVAGLPADINTLRFVLRGRRNGLFRNRRAGRIRYTAKVADRGTPIGRVTLNNTQRVYKKS